jgi:hypothetical protein
MKAALNDVLYSPMRELTAIITAQMSDIGA